MKRAYIIVVNVIIMVTILIFVVQYSGFKNKASYRRQVENFENTTVTMEKVTENYLEGEQRICDVWAKYINSRPMTMEEAASYIRVSHVHKNTSAHLIYLDTLTGLSTRPRQGTSDDFAVSYERLDLLDDADWIDETGGSVNITRAYTNPLNGEQSLAFCNRLRLYDTESDISREAVLLRVIPISVLEQKWVFPQIELKDADLSLIDSHGDYILKGSSFKNSSFFEFYKSYNITDPESSDKLYESITSSTGSVRMLNSHNEECILAFTPVSSTAGWTLLGIVPEEDLNVDTENWLLFGVVFTGLLILFLCDIFYMRYLNKRLQVLVMEAESANKAKTDFLSTMSHDIRTPMNAIIGLTAIAGKNLDDSESVADKLRKISLASNHLLTLINNILDISKVESGKLKLSPVIFSIVETVENLVNISQPMIKEKNLEFIFHTEGMKTEYLYADRLRLNQIYINILSNAVKYTEPGGSVNVDMREEKSDVPGSVRLIYIVSDTGIGMSPEYMTEMYKPFSRQIDSRVNSVQGTGLGLAITKQMVELLGGTIDCKSEQGKGTCFTVTLDIPTAQKQPEEKRFERIDILIVDDDDITLKEADRSLRSLGASVDTANSGQEALSLILDRHRSGSDYNVIIVDWKMPEMDGLETIRRIRSEAGDNVPILLISAYDLSDIEDKAKEAGANGYLNKPLFRSTLYDKINQLIGKESRSDEREDDYSDLKGMHILVAEDNDINWEIISHLLRSYGIVADRAENGRVCVDIVRCASEGSFELIFMDVQMPEMNGLDAARAIRGLPDSRSASIPIIAMTADAFSENVTECLNAGMNGHIAKPIDVKLVIKEIRRIREGK